MRKASLEIYITKEAQAALEAAERAELAQAGQPSAEDIIKALIELEQLYQKIKAQRQSSTLQSPCAAEQSSAKKAKRAVKRSSAKKAKRSKASQTSFAKGIRFHVFRTKLVGGGTSYQVLVPRDQKPYYPEGAIIYYREFNGQELEYYSILDFLRTPEVDELPAPSEERWNAFKQLEEIADQLEFEVACRAFPELTQLKAKPSPLFWASWDKEDACREVILAKLRFASFANEVCETLAGK